MSSPESILKFNVLGGGGGNWLSLGHLLRTWPPDMRRKNYRSLVTTLWLNHGLKKTKLHNRLCI
jgi:hypothetical protein